MHNPYAAVRRLSGLVILAGLLLSGCGEGETTTDLGPVDNGQEPDTAVAGLNITFIAPDPSIRPLVSGTYKVRFRYDDEMDLPADITVSMVRNKDFEPIVIGVDGSGEYSVDIDTTVLLEGNESIQVKAVSSDQRQVTVKGKILVDNKAPLIEILDPTPAANGNFIGGLTIRVRVTDQGNKVRNVRIAVKDFEWTWPEKAGDAAEVVDTRIVDGTEFTDLEVPVIGWVGENLIMTVTADDGLEGHDVLVEHPFTFVETPGFVGGEDVPLVSGRPASVVAGIRLGAAIDGFWGVAIADSNELGVYTRVSTGVLQYQGTLIKDNCPVIAIADMNDDGADDVVAFCGVEDTRRIVVMVQDEGYTFVEMAFIPLTVSPLEIAIGGLNSDQFPDIAFICENNFESTGIILSVVDDFADLVGWGDAVLYPGAMSPEHVAIGRFAANGRNAVVVGKGGDGLLTVFPVNQDGVATLGENGTVDPKGDIDDVSGLAAVNFASMSADPDTLIVIDSTEDGLLGAAGFESNSKRVLLDKLWLTGLSPQKLVVGDVDGNSVYDVAVLCPGANMVQVFMGIKGFTGVEYMRPGIAMLAGAARDLTLADMDGDGTQDIVLLNKDGTGLVIIYYREVQDGRRFEGSYQTVLGREPLSMVTGHFTAPLAGAKADYMDAAVLYAPIENNTAIGVFASNSVVGMPIEPAGSLPLASSSLTGLVKGNFDIHHYLGATDPETRPDDLIVLTTLVPQGDNTKTAIVVLFNEMSHTLMSASYREIDAGPRPSIGTVADFNELSSIGYDIMDVAFINYYDGESPIYTMQSMLGKMDGTFLPKTASGNDIEPMLIQEDRVPVKITAFAMKQVLSNYAQGKSGEIDLLVANSGTGDFTLFVSDKLGLFVPKTSGSRDFAVGGPPIDIKAGFLRNPVDGTAPADEALIQFADVAVLLSDSIVLSYSRDKNVLAQTGERVGFEPPVPIPYGGQAPVALELADMNGDGYLDIVVLDRDDSSVSIYVNLAQRRFSEPFKFETGTSPIEMSVVDMDADGCLDIVTADRQGNTLTCLRNTAFSCRK